MQKLKRILAILLVVLLVGLYLSTLVFAIIGSDRALDWLMASVCATIALPVLLWTYSFLYKKIQNAKKGGEDAE